VSGKNVAREREKAYTRGMIKRIFPLVVLACVLSVVSVAAQQRSLADMAPGEKFRTVEGGFEVGLPRDPAVEVSKTGTMLTWVVKEGVIIINYWDRGLADVPLPKGTARPALVEEFVNQYKKGMATVPNVTTGENKPSTLAGLNVTFFPTNYGKRPGLSSVYVEDHRSIMFLVIPLEEVPESQETISEAIETFKLIPKAR
jgi:hypothetical protein